MLNHKIVKIMKKISNYLIGIQLMLKYQDDQLMLLAEQCDVPVKIMKSILKYKEVSISKVYENIPEDEIIPHIKYYLPDNLVLCSELGLQDLKFAIMNEKSISKLKYQNITAYLSAGNIEKKSSIESSIFRLLKVLGLSKNL